MNDPVPASVSSRWLHRWALFTAAATVPLLLLGAKVTTLGAGMEDARGLRSPWYFFQEFVNHQGLDWRIEHGHRQAGWLVGFCVLVLTVWLWLAESRRGVRWLGLAALLAVCLQGTLGIFRIELHELLGKTLALIHGCFAQVVFAMLVCLALLTSRTWSDPPAGSGSRNLRAWALLTVGLVFGQLILGSLVRHQDFALAGRAHLLVAFAVVAAVLGLARLAFEQNVATRAVKILLALVAIQVFLGVEAWLSKFFVETAPWSMLVPLAVHADWFRTLHYVTGTFILATTVVIALRVQQALAGQRRILRRAELRKEPGDPAPQPGRLRGSARQTALAIPEMDLHARNPQRGEPA